MKLTLSIKGSPVETRILDTEGIYIREHRENIRDIQLHDLKVKYAKDISMSDGKWEIYLSVKSRMYKPVLENMTENIIE